MDPIWGLIHEFLWLMMPFAKNRRTSNWNISPGDRGLNKECFNQPTTEYNMIGKSQDIRIHPQVNGV